MIRNVVDQSNSPKQASSEVEYAWVDPKVTRIASTFLTEVFVSKFFAGVPVLKPDARSSFFSVEPCLPTESVCMGQPGTSPPFFYMY